MMGSKVKGFSLIELIIAMFLMAMMGVLMLNSLSSSVRAKETVEKTSEKIQVARQALRRITKEISMAYVSKNRDGQNPSYVTQFKGYRDKLFFSAFGNIVRQKDAKVSDQQVLGYFVTQDKHGNHVLARKHRANLNMDVEKEGVDEVLSGNVKKIRFQYFNVRNEKWDDSWFVDLGASKGASSGDAHYSLPSRVKVEITFTFAEDKETVWTTEAEIFVTEPLDLS